MKKITLLLLLVLSQSFFAQTKLTETQKLTATCKVWGYLKYYHPKVADGSKNWDEQLFEVLSKVEKANTKEEFSLVLENWIDGLGEVPANKPLALESDTDFFTKNLDLEWTQENKLFSKKLSQKLQFITANRFQGKNHYVNLEGDSVHLQFTNELVYTDFPWTDKNLRILALFRYWNYVEYFFPYKYQMDQNWDEALVEILPHIATPNSEKDFLLAMRELSIKLGDTHAATSNVEMFKYLGGEKYTAFGSKFVDNKAVIVSVANDSLAKIDDLKIGDIITKVDGVSVAQRLDELLKYMQGSNKTVATVNGGFVMFTGNTDDLEIEFIRGNISLVKKVHRYLSKDIKRTPPKITPKWKLLENNIGYVDMSKVEVDDVMGMMKELKSTKTIIFDVRRRPAYTNFLINDYLNPMPKEFSRHLYQDLSFPGRYIWEKEIQTCGKINLDYYKGKVIILVNSGTHSFGEHTAMSLQTAPNATTIGSQTSGADGANYYFAIIKGFDSSFTSSGIFYPNKNETQRVGISLDIAVKPTIIGAQQGKDEVLDRAIQFIETGK
jgi:C-terminal processing protease CtpA/Prc